MVAESGRESNQYREREKGKGRMREREERIGVSFLHCMRPRSLSLRLCVRSLCSSSLHYCLWPFIAARSAAQRSARKSPLARTTSASECAAVQRLSARERPLAEHNASAVGKRRPHIHCSLRSLQTRRTRRKEALQIVHTNTQKNCIGSSSNQHHQPIDDR